ncbi:MAG: hypothetical protein WC312_07990 [Candidatus Omnitrophota bacterium]|jgi:hydrogenase maturation protein HypF
MEYIQIELPYKMRNNVLALGAQSKSAFCFAAGNAAYLSDFGGNLGELENFKKFEGQLKALRKELKIKLDTIACDLHPGYISTGYAPRIADGLPVVKVQHHEAHIASCMAENKIKGKVIGVAFDGTGFGRDGNIWGGEFFIGGIKGFKRAAHLKYVPMPGGEAAIREPWRMAFSYLYAIGGGTRKTRNDIIRQMIDKKINTPLTSSMGRLFDGISSLIGICDIARYEGEAAIKLEKIMEGVGHYKFNYDYKNEIIIIDWGPVIKSIVKDLKRGIKKPEISLKFHNGVCDMIKDVCGLLRKKYKIRKACISGGVFQNKYLSGRIKPILEEEGFDVYAHEKVPAHDGGIALGQAILAGV